MGWIQIILLLAGAGSAGWLWWQASKGFSMKSGLAIAWVCIWRMKLRQVRALYAQAYLETGGFTSAMYLKCNNLFGMQVANVRPKAQDGACMTTVEGTFARFKSRCQSVRDRLLWDKYVGVGYHNVDTYMQSVKDKGYATDPDYVTKWKQIYLQGNVATVAWLSIGFWVVTISSAIYGAVWFARWMWGKRNKRR